MKIAVNASIVDANMNGSAVHAIRVVRELAHLLSNQDKLVVFTSCPELFAGLNVDIAETPVSLQPQYGKQAAIYRFLWNQIIFPFKLWGGNFDIIYSPAPYASFFIKNQIITILDLLPVRFPEQYKLQAYYFKYAIPFLLKKCVKILTISESSKKDIIEYYKVPMHKVEAIYCGGSNLNTEINIYKASLVKEKYGLDKYIMCVGASHPHKNLDRLILAFAKISNQIEENLVIVGGRKEYRDKLKTLVEALHLTKRVTFYDYIPSEELSYFYNFAKVLVYPSLYEGFGIPPLEAMTYSCPVVASNNSSIPEVCADAAYYIDPLDVDSIADGILAVLNGTQLRTNLIRAGLERVKCFCWESTARQTLDVFKAILLRKK